MAMSHELCTHPRTPAGRAWCRKNGGAASSQDIPAGVTITVEPRKTRRAPAKVTTPDVPGTRIRKSAGTPDSRDPIKTFSIKTIGDLANGVPHVFGTIIRRAWDEGWHVTGEWDTKRDHKKVIITSEFGHTSLVWDAAKPNTFRSWWFSYTTRVWEDVTEPHILDAMVRRLMGKGPDRV